MAFCSKVQFKKFRDSVPRFALKLLWFTQRVAR